VTVLGAGRAALAAPRLAGSIRAAATDFLGNSWRLLVANLVWGFALVALLGAVAISPLAWLLAPLLALPTVGIYRVAALLVRGEPVSVRDGFGAWRRFGGRAMVVGALLLGCVAVFATNLVTGIQNSGVVGWSLATFAGWGLVATAIASSVVWPLLVDPWRGRLGLGDVLRLTSLLALAFPLRFGALAAVLVLLVALSTFAVVVVFSIAIGFAALIACRYVLPAADRFLPPADQPDPAL
jgi:hypothetical protein